MNTGRRPLDFLPSIKVKLGVIIVAAVGAAVVVVFAAEQVGVRLRFSAPLAGLVALGIVQLLARGMVSPLREMAAAAAAMARGDYSQRVRDSSRDEVGELARAFNAMAAELAELDRLRRDLVANVSHELRTPITALRATLENLVDGVEPPDPAALRTMLTQVERLGRLVAQLLDLSRLESNVVPLHRRPFRILDVLQQAVNEAMLAQPPVRFLVDVRPDHLACDGDPERVHQVVANLVQNAVRHSPSGATVSLVATRSGRGVTLEVADEGPGIDPAEATRVFERFYRADAARSSAQGGAGLGLAIAKWIVDAHGGRISALPRVPRGCRMVVTLPAAEAAGVREGMTARTVESSRRTLPSDGASKGA